jgi:serine/threonine protein kinase
MTSEPTDPSAVSLPAPDPLAVTRDSVPGAPPLPPVEMPPELASHPDYEVQRKLGQGGMGVVYLARNKVMDCLEVLKVVNQSLLGRSGALERFLQEIRSAAKLQHPNVVTAHAVLRLGDLLVLAMEYVDGVDLSKLVRQQGPLPVDHACHFARQAALGLQAAHELGMVHRDIKPSNLMLGRKSVVKILDFGLVKVRQEAGEDTGLTGTNVMMGTPDHMAPEQAVDARGADIRADIYSLGCTQYFLLTGRPPFQAKNTAEAVLAHALKPPPSVAELRAEVPAGLAALVARMLAKKPAERPQTPAEVAHALVPFIKGEGAQPPPPPEPASTASLPPPVRPKKVDAKPSVGRKVGLWVAGALLGLLVVLGIFLQVKGKEHRPGEVINVSLGPGVEMKFAWVPPGDSWLGGGGGEPGTKRFTLKQGLWCGVYPVTQAEWQAVMGDNPSSFKGNPRYPVESVSWNRVQDFLKQLNQRASGERLLYRLPTEEEWEYICRGGPLSQEQSKYDFYFARSKTDLTPAPSNDLSSTQANFNGNFPAGSASKGPYLKRPSDVGSYVPNPLGIYDLHGNVWEWTASVDEGGSSRLFRGGGWSSFGAYCGATFLFSLAPDGVYDHLGFRLLAVPSGK